MKIATVQTNGTAVRSDTRGGGEREREREEREQQCKCEKMRKFPL